MQSADSKNGIGVAFVGIGEEMIFLGFVLIRPSFEE